MKRIIIPLLFLASFCVWAAPVSVQVKDASFYDQPSAVSKFLGKVPYGTSLTVLETKNGWSRVKSDSPALTGWIRSQSYTSKNLALKSGTDASGVSSNYVSLAGRGFSEEVEQNYKTKNPSLDYADVDKMEAQTVPEGDLETFLKDGGLSPDGARK